MDSKKKSTNDAFESNANFHITPNFKKNWLKSGGSENSVQLLQNALVDNPDLGDLLSPRSPHIRVLNYPLDETKNTYINVFYLNICSVSQLILFDIENEDNSVFLHDPENASRFFEKLSLLLDALTSAVV